MIVFSWLFVRPWLGSKLTETVASATKRSPYGAPAEWGYSVERYRWRTGFRVKIWAGESFSFVLDEPELGLTRVKTERWLLEDRAILLEVDCIYHDSVDSAEEMGWLFDFETGELRAYGRSPVRAQGQRRGRRVTKDEFHRFVESISVPAQ